MQLKRHLVFRSFDLQTVDAINDKHVAPLPELAVLVAKGDQRFSLARRQADRTRISSSAVALFMLSRVVSSSLGKFFTM